MGCKNWEDIQNIQVGEELKITVALSLKKLTMSDTQKGKIIKY